MCACVCACVCVCVCVRACVCVCVCVCVGHANNKCIKFMGSLLSLHKYVTKAEKVWVLQLGCQITTCTSICLFI